jgi:hypothetical protein
MEWCLDPTMVRIFPHKQTIKRKGAEDFAEERKGKNFAALCVRTLRPLRLESCPWNEQGH